MKALCRCPECEDVRKRYNALIANGLVWRARPVGRTYDALQRAHTEGSDR